MLYEIQLNGGIWKGSTSIVSVWKTGLKRNYPLVRVSLSITFSSNILLLAPRAQRKNIHGRQK